MVNRERKPGTIASEANGTIGRVDGIGCQLELWDTSGQESYNQLRISSYSNAKVVLICYLEESSTDSVREIWAPEVKGEMPRRPIHISGNSPRRYEELTRKGRRA